MSFSRLALRISAVRALKGATLVGDNVRDSDITAIDQAADGSLRIQGGGPFVVIYTDESDAEPAAMRRELIDPGQADCVFEFGLASNMVSTNDRGESEIVGVGIPATDAAMEMALDMIDAQIVRALTGPGTWPGLWRSLSSGVSKIERRRASGDDDGTRIAARQIRVSLDLRPDPVLGAPLTGVWAKFQDAIGEADPDLAAVISTFLGAGEPATLAEQIQRRYGQRDGAARALRYTPADETRPAATVAEGEVEQ